MGKELFTLDLTNKTSYTNIYLKLSGAAAGGYWLFFDNIEKSNLCALSVLS